MPNYKKFTSKNTAYSGDIKFSYYMQDWIVTFNFALFSAVRADECPINLNFSANQKKLESIDLMVNDNEKYPTKEYLGRISELDFNRDAGDLDSIAIILDDGVEEAFNVPDGLCLSNMSQPEKSWIYEFLKKGKKIKLIVNFMGSAQLPVVRKIFPNIK